ncbi:MAG: LuxR C-terminal-related transcriptional regulator, partial [Rhodococcus sp. (in: high G+C Gram-positive bacteria)]
VHARVHVGNDIEDALCRLRELEIGESGSPELDSYALLIAGLAELHLGRTTEAQRCLEDAVANGRAGNLPAVVTTCLVTSAGICFLTGRLTEALARGQRAVTYARLHSLTDTPLFSVAESLELLVAHIRMTPTFVAPEDVWSSIGRSADSAVAQYGKRAALVLNGTIEEVSAAGREWIESVHPVVPAYEALLAPMVQRRYLTAGETLWATELIAVTRRRLGKVGEVALLSAEIHRVHGRFDVADSELAAILGGQLPCAGFTTTIRAAITAAKVALARRNPARAFELVCRALAEAEPEAILLPFAEGGAALRDILTHNRGRFGLLEPFADRAREVVPRHPAAAESRMSGALTPRELELLRELPSWRTAEQIASDHFVSVNTVKTHLRGIYRKLEVRSRRDAIAAAHEHGLL